MEAFKNFSEAIKAWAIIISIAVGGLWTYNNFTTLYEKERAEADLNTLRLKIEQAKTELETARKNLRGQAAVMIDVTGTQLSGKDPKDKLLQLTVGVRNAGTKNTIIDWGNAELSIREAAFIEHDNTPTYAPRFLVPIHNDEFPLGREHIKSGQSSSTPFLVRLNNSGIYYVKFSVPIPADEGEDAVATGISESVKDRGRWTVGKYFIVE